jgi:hypothetical protein
MDLLQALHDAGFAAALRRADILYPFLNAAHILSFGVVIGAIGTLDIRLLGAFRTFSLGQLAPPLSRMAAVGVVSAFATGFFLFSVQPMAYAQNTAFLMKVSLAIMGVMNALILHKRAAWRDALASGAAPASVKAQAAASLLIWVMAVASGRWIAFVD